MPATPRCIPFPRIGTPFQNELLSYLLGQETHHKEGGLCISQDSFLGRYHLVMELGNAG